MKLIRRFRKFLEEMKDHKLNRELVGMDKYGNKYYQYYSSFGLPTRREEEERRIKALEWDRKEQKFLEEFRKKREEIEAKWGEKQALTHNEGEKFEPEAWKPLKGPRSRS